ncbi:MAG: type II toxin-antitoxin system HicA family toxin [Chloroflexota bacterium]
MSRWTPCKRRAFIRRLRKLGFEGPYSGTRHQFFVYRHQRLTVPSNAEYSVPQLRMLLEEAENILGWRVTLDEWERLR